MDDTAERKHVVFMLNLLLCITLIEEGNEERSGTRGAIPPERRRPPGDELVLLEPPLSRSL